MKILLLKIRLSVFILLLMPAFIFAQSSKKLIHDGNKKYEAKKYSEAETEYKKALLKNEHPFEGNYNLGNTYYQEGKFEEATQQYMNAAGTKEKNSEDLAKTMHNLGNSYIKNKKYQEGIEAYKQALKLNPKDNDTRYNLAYAQAKLQQQQQQQQGDDKNKDKDKKDQQKKDQKDKQQQKEQEQKQDQAKQDQQKQAQPKKDKISKEDAEKILQALNNDEKKTQKKLNIKESTKVQVEKEW